jgi:putative tryptophan/tyrosine transport system substrate-binding protein
VGLFNPGVPVADGSMYGAPLIRGLEKHGYSLGHNMVFERRGAEGRVEHLPRLLDELVASKVDVILALGYPAALTAKNGTSLPVVVVSVGDPVASGLVDNLARPGGRLTGISDLAAELAPKRLQLLKEMAPGMRRVAMLWNASDPGMTLRYRVSEAAAQALGIKVEALGVRSVEDFEPALSAMRQNMPDAIFVVDDRLTGGNRGRIFEFAAANRLPAIVRAGGLMSYGPDLDESMARAGSLIDRILKGAKPQDLPFEQPTRYRLAINLKTAKAIGLDVPQSIVTQADDVIE